MRFLPVVLTLCMSCLPSGLKRFELDENSGSITLAVSVRNESDWTSRVASVTYDVRAGSDGTVRRTQDATAAEREITLGGLPAGLPIRITATATSSAGEVIYRGKAEIESLAVGQAVQRDFSLNGLPAVQLVATRGQAGDITVVYDLRDPEGDPCTVGLQYRGGKNIAVFGVAATDGPTSNITPGLAHELRWLSNAASDEPGRSVVVQLRLTVTDTDAGLAAESSQLAIENDSAAPPAPDALAPQHAFASATPEVCWNNAGAGAIYQVRVSLALSGEQVAQIETQQTCATLPSLEEGDYRFVVQARNKLGASSPEGGSADFTVDLTAPGTPVPAAFSTTQLPVALDFNWPAVTGANSYRFELGTDPTFTTGVLVSQTVTDPTVRYRPDPFDKTYYYRVQAIDAAGNTSAPSSPALALDIDATPPPPPLLVQPPAVQSNTTPTLRWTASGSDLAGFTVQVATSPTFGPGDILAAIAASGAQRQVTLGTPLTGAPATTYWFRVLAQDVAGNVSTPPAAAEFAIDTEAPGVPSTCRLDGSLCFDNLCHAMNTHSPALLFTPPIADVDHYEVVVSGGASTLTLTPAVQSSGQDVRAVLDLSPLSTGTYAFSVYAVDAAGTRSTEAPCASGVQLDLTPPPPPRLLGAYVPRSKENTGSAEVTPTLYFTPSSTSPDLAPIVGYYYTFSTDDGAELDRCAIAMGGSGPTGAVTSCSRNSGSTYFACDTPAGPCKISDAAVLAASDDRIYRITLASIDAAGNQSVPASLGPRFDTLATNEVYADVSAPALAEPLDPASCSNDTTFDPRALPQHKRATLTWSSVHPQPRALVTLSMQQQFVWHCNQSFSGGTEACRGDVYCEPQSFSDPPDRVYNCALCESVGEVTTLGGPASLSCSAQPSQTCLRPKPTGGCDSEFSVTQGWTCKSGTCTYQTLVADVGSASVDLAQTGDFPGAFWYVRPVDGAGHYEEITDATAQVDQRFLCPNGFQYKSTRYRLDRSPVVEPPFYTDLQAGGRADIVSPTFSATRSSAHPYLMFQVQNLTGPIVQPSIHVQVQRFDGGVAGDLVYDKVFSCSGQQCECPNADLAQCDFAPIDGFPDGLAHRVETTLGDGEYRWRFRVEDQFDNVAGWYGCSQFAQYTLDGQVLCDEWARNPGSNEGRFSIIGGGGSAGSVPAILWPPASADCDTSMALAWTTVGATQYNVEFWTFTGNSPLRTVTVMATPSALQTYQVSTLIPPLPPGWYWARVNAQTSQAASDWSAPLVFRYQGPTQTNCSLPP